jgi:hypothetical protein
MCERHNGCRWVSVHSSHHGSRQLDRALAASTSTATVAIQPVSSGWPARRQQRA